MTAAQTPSAPDAVLALEGDLTIYTAAETLARLRDYLHARLDSMSCDVDLSGVTEFDSAGLQLLLWSKRAAEAQGMRLHLLGRSAAVAEDIALLQLEPVFGSQPAQAADGAV